MKVKDLIDYDAIWHKYGNDTNSFGTPVNAMKESIKKVLPIILEMVIDDKSEAADKYWEAYLIKHFNL